MKKLLVVLLGLFIMGCSDDCTSTYDVYEYVGEQRSSNEGVLIVSQDMCVESLPVYFSIIIKNNSTLTVYGENEDVNTEGSLTFDNGGTLNVSNSLLVGNKIYFNKAGSSGTINAVDRVVAEEINAKSGVSAVVNYGSVQDEITSFGDVTQNYVSGLEIDQCQTLSDNSVQGHRYLGRRDSKCNMQDTPEFKYVEVQ